MKNKSRKELEAEVARLNEELKIINLAKDKVDNFVQHSAELIRLREVNVQFEQVKKVMQAYWNCHTSPQDTLFKLVKLSEDW